MTAQVIPFRREMSSAPARAAALDIRPVANIDDLVVRAIAALDVLADEAAGEGLDDLALSAQCCSAMMANCGG